MRRSAHGGTDKTHERQLLDPTVTRRLSVYLRRRTPSTSGHDPTAVLPSSRGARGPVYSFDGTTPLTRNRPAAPESWRESENHRRAHRAKYRHFPIAHLANTAAEQPETRQPRRGGPITGKAASDVVPSVPTDGLNHRGFDAGLMYTALTGAPAPEGTNSSFIHR